MNFKRHIPNTITCCNLLSGCAATVCALIGMTEEALLLIILGAVFDFFDGMSARLLHVSSEIGKELDSLADDITFGVAPASIIFWHLGTMNYPEFIEEWRPVLPFVAYIVSAFSALRLAKFNLDTRQTTSFIGLPTPANALLWGGLFVAFGNEINNSDLGLPLTLIGIAVSSWLLVSEIPMFALKFKHWGFKGNEVKYGFVAFSAAMIIVTLVIGMTSYDHSMCYASLPAIIIAYIAVSIFMANFLPKKGC